MLINTVQKLEGTKFPLEKTWFPPRAIEILLKMNNNDQILTRLFSRGCLAGHQTLKFNPNHLALQVCLCGAGLLLIFGFLEENESANDNRQTSLR
jgi:hypothetical protein